MAGHLNRTSVTIPPERYLDYFLRCAASSNSRPSQLPSQQFSWVLATLTLVKPVHYVNLYERHQQINRENFDAKPLYVSVPWADLSAQNADGIISFDDNDRPVSIELDRQRITSERDLLAALRHGACHVAVGAKVAHGSAWQHCMDRFQD